MEDRCVELGRGWWVLLLGWPAVWSSLLAFIVATVRNSRAAAVAGLILVTPMLLYLSATPRFRWTAPASYLLLCVLVWRFSDWRPWTRLLLALPAAGILLWLARMVVTQ